MRRIRSSLLETPAIKASSCDAHLLAILDASADSADAIERELAALPIFDQRALYVRLAQPRTGDRLAERFGRLVAERRARLLQFLGDVRRRATMLAR
ncbi:MAG TPA: hypothetical protein VH143_33890 [Kofleriaceae bacterium]|nr:hypothetical protein [Kofleriaceae bacterium]